MSTTTVATTPPASDTLIVMTREEQEPETTQFRARFDPTPLEVEWADTHLAGLDVLIRDTTLTGEEGVVSIREASDGSWWRYPGSISVRQHADGAWRFTICLYRGATTHDLLVLRRVVRAAQDGQFVRAGWCKRTTQDGGDAWIYDLGYPCAAPDQDVTYRGMYVTACTDSRCQEDTHVGVDIEHTADETTGKRWTIAVSRLVDPDEEDEKFEVYVELEGKLNEREASAFANDLAWMQAACRKANATVSDPSRKGWTTPKPSDTELVAA